MPTSSNRRLVAGVWLWLAAASCQPSPATTPEPRAPTPASAGQTLPSLTLNDLALQPVTLPEALRGRVGVVDLWATWCIACKADHEALERLARAYPSAELAIVGVNQGEEGPHVREYTQAHAFSYAVWLDRDLQLSAALGETSLPAVYVVDPAGKLVHRASGLDARTLEVIRQQVEHVRAAASATASAAPTQGEGR